ncbi:SDR family NAD(P)-dependent oxidoreductase [Novosphingobium sp. KCTC 2891]|uniref:SDR family oxidoreductase n=1 Tax=unclassified Novosphingobium TaxID=2644732 RepID=UPI0022235783|nr:SDR family NAD(P)-dependent oxidoreductase [Novosphingobium sp. KCTC 2891]MCW1384795.1 SDR family NAD(P)-dependent oxidoreductase [Novosphingobium sp. KCTC 2891]
MIDWKNKFVVVTGAGSGIGRAMAVALVASGARVLACDIVEPALLSLADELGDAVQTHVCDMADPLAIEALGAAAVEQFGTIDAVFANAGVIANGPLIKASVAEFDWVFGVNVRGAWATMSTFARIMLQQDSGGRICVTASEHALGLQHAGAGIYTASKHAVLGLADVLRAELPPNIGISVFCPGLVATDLGNAPRPDGVAVPGERQRALGKAVQSQGMPASLAAQAALDGTARGDFLIVTHANALAAAQRRAAEIEAAFAAQAPASGDVARYDVNRIVSEILAAQKGS